MSDRISRSEIQFNKSSEPFIGSGLFVLDSNCVSTMDRIPARAVIIMAELSGWSAYGCPVGTTG